MLKRRRIGESFRRNESLQSREPMFVISCAVVRTAPVRCAFQFVGQRRGPFTPGKITLLGEANRQGEGLSLPWFVKNLRSAWETGSGWLKIVVPQIDVDCVARRGLLAPKLARREPSRIDVLRVFAERMRRRVGKYVDTMIAIDDSEFAARVTRQARVSQPGGCCERAPIRLQESAVRSAHRGSQARRRAAWKALDSR